MLIVNPRSGGGKAERFGLVAECVARGIEPIVFNPGDDLHDIALAAVTGGADAIGVAGGDGSQALVAALAAEHDLAYVCIPAGHATTSPPISVSIPRTLCVRSMRSRTA